jgi:hypothetical protein
MLYLSFLLQLVLELIFGFVCKQKTNKQTLWFQYTNKLYRWSDRRLLAKLVPTLADRGCHMVSATNTHGR